MMKLLLSVFLVTGVFFAAAQAGGKKPVQTDRGVASKEDGEKPKKSCPNSEELREDGNCVRIERQKPYRPDRM